MTEKRPGKAFPLLENNFLTCPVRKTFSNGTGFTLVELMVAVAVIAVGMVFILGAFSQCLSALTTARKMVTANYLLNGKIWESDLAIKLENGSQEGEWSGVFLEPYESFNWTHKIQALGGNFGNESLPVAERLNEETMKVSWLQGRLAKDVSVVRYVKRKNETAQNETGP